MRMGRRKKLTVKQKEKEAKGFDKTIYSIN